MGRRTVHALIVAAMSAALTVGLALVPSTAGAAVRGTGPLSLATGAYFGALVNPNRNTPSSTPAEVAALETKIGRGLDVINHFYIYGTDVGTQGEQGEVSAGKIPMITWGATSTSRINQGLEDAYIRRQAIRMRDLGGPVFLRYFHEPEGDYRNTIVQSAAAYITAWKRAQRLFREEGATNVVWMWTTTAYSFRVNTARDPRTFYPGDPFVDWIATDGYNFAPGKPGAQWNSFTTVFSRWYAWAQTKPKPLMIAEYGVMEDPSQPTRKATWYNDMRAAVKTTFPLVQGVVAWSTTNTKEGNVYNWNVDSSANSLAAWDLMADDPYFNPRN